MAKKKPRWGWTNTGWEAPAPFTANDSEKIHALLKARFENDHLGWLNSATKRYLAENPDRPPNISEVRVALNEIEKRTQGLLTCLERLDDISKDCLQVPGELYDQTQKDVQSLWMATQTALRDLPTDKGGRPADVDLKEYIIKLADIFEEVVKSKPRVSYNPHSESTNQTYKGVFFSFVEFCLNHINKQPYSNQSLGEAIKRALKERKERL